jgi:hypothetical protein
MMIAPMNAAEQECNRAMALLYGNIHLRYCVLLDTVILPNLSTEGGVENERHNEQVKKLAHLPGERDRHLFGRSPGRVDLEQPGSDP